MFSCLFLIFFFFFFFFTCRLNYLLFIFLFFIFFYFFATDTIPFQPLRYQVWKDDMAHGQGTKTFAGGDSHCGSYVEDNRHGYGVYKWSSGDTFSGYWKKGEMHGKGTYLYTNGDVYQGKWVDGKKDGKGLHSTANSTFEEVWESGTRVSKTEVAFVPPRLMGTTSDEATIDSLKDEVKRLRSQIEFMQENGSSNGNCTVCYEGAIDAVIIPCGHMCVCMSCTEHLQRCPICRTDITEVVRTYRV